MSIGLFLKNKVSRKRKCETFPSFQVIKNQKKNTVKMKLKLSLTSCPFHMNVTAWVPGPSCSPFSTIAIRSHVAQAIAGLHKYLLQMLCQAEEKDNLKQQQSMNDTPQIKDMLYTYTKQMLTLTYSSSGFGSQLHLNIGFIQGLDVRKSKL